MTKWIVPAFGSVALMAQIFVFQGCGGSNTASVTAGTGGATVSAGTGGASGTGTGGATAGAGTGGSTTTAGTGGATASADGGTPGFGLPTCGNTAAGVAIAKNGTCVAADTQLCYKTCGPEKSGVKSETCTAGAYAEMSGCSFDPMRDFTCYKVPATIAAQDARCPTTQILTAPVDGSVIPCTVPDCVVCGLSAGYADSTGAAKTGYCVCQANGNWSCASSTAWPCPGNLGC